MPTITEITPADAPAPTPAAATSSTKADDAGSSVAVELSDSPADDPTLEPLKADNPNYCETVRRGLLIEAGEGFADIEAMDVFRISKIPDNDGRTVFIFLPENLPDYQMPRAARDEIVERATLYAFTQLHKHVVREQREYTAVWLCMNDEERWSPLPMKWWRRTYKATPRLFMERLGMLNIVHPSLSVRSRMLALSYLTNGVADCWEKINYADRLEFLDCSVPVKLIKTLPESVKDYDRYQDKLMMDSLHNKDPMSTYGKYSGMGGMGGMMGMGGMGGMGMSSMMSGMQAMGIGGDLPDPNAGMGDLPKELPKRNWERDDD